MKCFIMLNIYRSEAMVSYLETRLSMVQIALKCSLHMQIFIYPKKNQKYVLGVLITLTDRRCCRAASILRALSLVRTIHFLQGMMGWERKRELRRN